MKIEITAHTLAEVGNAIAASAMKIIQDKVNRLDDVELVAEIRATQIPDYSKVVGYLTHTKLHAYSPILRRVENRFLAQIFGLHVLAMKRIRDRLLLERGATVRREDDRLWIYFARPQTDVLNTGAQATGANAQ